MFKNIFCFIFSVGVFINIAYAGSCQHDYNILENELNYNNNNYDNAGITSAHCHPAVISLQSTTPTNGRCYATGVSWASDPGTMTLSWPIGQAQNFSC